MLNFAKFSLTNMISINMSDSLWKGFKTNNLSNPANLGHKDFKQKSSSSARRKNPPSRGAGCALQQECRRDFKPRQLPTTKHFENSSIIFIAAHQKSQTTRSCKFLSVLAPKSVGRVFGSWHSTTTIIIIIIKTNNFF